MIDSAKAITLDMFKVQAEAKQARIAELEAALNLCERALSHNSLAAMSEDKLAQARMACRVALGRHDAVEASRAALAKATE